MIHGRDDTHNMNKAARTSLSKIFRNGSARTLSYAKSMEALAELVKEILIILNSDILPRWKKRAAIVDSFLFNKPFSVDLLAQESIRIRSKLVQDSNASCSRAVAFLTRSKKVRSNKYQVAPSSSINF